MWLTVPTHIMYIHVLPKISTTLQFNVCLFKSTMARYSVLFSSACAHKDNEARGEGLYIIVVWDDGLLLCVA